MLDLIIKNGKCYIEGELKDADVGIKNEKIQHIGQIYEDAKELQKSYEKQRKLQKSYENN